MDGAFETFASGALPRLRRALIGQRGIDGASDAAAEALAYAWEHWDRVSRMDNPIGYLYRVAQSRTRARKQGLLPTPTELGIPDIEPQLVPALQRLGDRQRTAVWLIHACDWRPAEVGTALGISASAASTHAARGLAKLRADMEARTDADA
jgi:DNA-directed RNA polymerase specialized sigma24 family protein